MNADAQERVMERLWSRGAVASLVPMLGSGELDERVYADGIQRLSGMAPSDVLGVLGPYVAKPGSRRRGVAAGPDAGPHRQR